MGRARQDISHARRRGGPYGTISLRMDAQGSAEIAVAGLGVPTRYLEMLTRAGDLKTLFRRLIQIGWHEDPARRDRGDRYRGDVAREKGGRMINWSPGYRPYERATALTRSIKLRYTRPFPPVFSAAARDELAAHIRRWVLEGVLP